MKKSLTLVLVLILIAAFNSFTSCKKFSTTPRLTTTAVSPISISIVSSGGEILNDGGAVVTSKGVCWDTSINPTISLVTKTAGVGGVTFTSVIGGLKSNKTYYIRAYATNKVGVSYGNQITYVTPADPLDTIVGTYFGIVHYTTDYRSTYDPSKNRSFDTTYSFGFIVSKVSNDTFNTNTTYSTCVFSEISTYWGFVYNPSNVYRVLYYPCSSLSGYSIGGDLKFDLTTDSVWYNVCYSDQSGGGKIFSYTCREIFSGRKL